MSIATEYTRLKNAKEDIKASITGKGITVPDGTKLDGMPVLIDEITTADKIIHSDVPDYVKAEALEVVNKVKSVQTSTSIIFIAISDPHHATDESTGWKAKIETGNLDACRAIKAISFMLPIDFAVFLGDLTFGYKTTTVAQFEAQCKEFHSWIDEGFKGIPQLWTVGNHDTGEYLAANTGNLSDLYGSALIKKYFSDYNEGAVYGNTTVGYCYRDFDSKKIRVINLNTVETEMTEGENASSSMSNAQLLWFAQTLYSLGSKSDASSWGFIILGHYPLDWGYRAAGQVLNAYLDGTSITVNGTTIDFAGKNGAVCYGNFHGHLHNFVADKIYIIPDNVSSSNPPTEQMPALRICTPSANYYRTNEVGDNGRLDSNQIEFGEDTTYNKSDGVEDTSFVVNVINPSEKRIYSFCYGAGHDRILSFDFTVVMRSIISTLTHCTISNPATAIEDGSTYTATLTLDSGYSFESVTVTMGGTDITSMVYSDGSINIPNVTGDIVITAVAIKPIHYTNLVDTAIDSNGVSAPYTDGAYMSSNGLISEGTGTVTTGFIPIDGGNSHIYRIGGEGITWNTYPARIAWYNSNFALKGDVMNYSKVGSSQYYPVPITGENTAASFQTNENFLAPIGAAYFRVCAKGKGANLIITLDEPIE